ncbi:MAG: Ribosomal silencing factor RsfS [Chlamydiae bacterium]|nr:Ribosomal silencing factor RsfS [Chlamydiota bacterium]
MNKKDLDLIAQAIFDKKGFNIFVLDVRELTTITDYFIIAEGNVDRHVRAIGEEIIEEMEKVGHEALRVEGRDFADWMVIDFGDVFVHLFTPGVREKYRLELLWQEGKIVDVAIDISKKNVG